MLEKTRKTYDVDGRIILKGILREMGQGVMN
jgi:hypothetical protein